MTLEKWYKKMDKTAPLPPKTIKKLLNDDGFEKK